jgi:hypothetical protein
MTIQVGNARNCEDQADLQEIETAFAAITVHGARMNEMQMEVVEP